MITCGTEILGPVRFTSSGAIAHVRSAFPAMSSAKIDEDNFWGSAVVQEPGNDVLICDISNCGEQVRLSPFPPYTYLDAHFAVYPGNIFLRVAHGPS